MDLDTVLVNYSVDSLEEDNVQGEDCLGEDRDRDHCAGLEDKKHLGEAAAQDNTPLKAEKSRTRFSTYLVDGAFISLLFFVSGSCKCPYTVYVFSPCTDLSFCRLSLCGFEYFFTFTRCLPWPTYSCFVAFVFLFDSFGSNF